MVVVVVAAVKGQKVVIGLLGTMFLLLGFVFWLGATGGGRGPEKLESPATGSASDASNDGR